MDRNSSSIGSINGEWKACETRKRFDFQRSAIATTACSGPAMTTDSGPLTAAIVTPSVRCGRTTSSLACTATIAPPAGSACISADRTVTSFAASRRLSTPATWAAAISPIEWPARKSGFTPHDSTSRNSATSIANSAGCVVPVRLSRSWSSPQMTFSRSAPRWPSTSSKASLNTGNRACSSRPMPRRCEPWPANRNASLPERATSSLTTSGFRTSAAIAASASVNSSRLLASTTARWSNEARAVAADRAMPTRSASTSSKRAAWSRTAADVRPDTSTGTTPKLSTDR